MIAETTTKDVIAVASDELRDLGKLAKSAELEDSGLRNNEIIDAIMYGNPITDIYGDDVTNLCRSHIIDDGIEQSVQAMEDVQTDIYDDGKACNQKALASDSISYKSICKCTSFSWIEDIGSRHGTSNYFTDVMTSTVLGWLKAMKRIIKDN